MQAVTIFRKLWQLVKAGTSQARVTIQIGIQKPLVVHREVAEAEFDDFLKIEMKVAEV